VILRSSGLVVNSTLTSVDKSEADKGICNVTPKETSPTCTLAQAMTVSNHVGGETIEFDIPHGAGNTFDDGVPQIKMPERPGAVLEIVAPTVIDGTTQPNGGRVELSGEEDKAVILPGIVVGPGGGGSTIEGMVVNGFTEMIDLRAGDNKIYGDWLGTTAAGTAADATPLGPGSQKYFPLAQVAVRVQSSGNQIGGPGTGQGNVISSGYTSTNGPDWLHELLGAGEIDDTTGGNVIQGNHIGLAPGSGAPLIGLPPKVAPLLVERALSLSGDPDTVGGSFAGDGNVIAGGGTVSAGTVLQANSVTDGGLAATPVSQAASEGALTVTGAVTVGGPTPTPGQGDGNDFYAVHPLGPELQVEGSGAVVEGNVFRDDADGAIVDAGTNVTIGGASEYGVENLIEDNGEIPPPVPGPDGPEQGEPLAAVRVAGGATATVQNVHALVEHNDFEDNVGGGAVSIDGGVGITVTDNIMHGNVQGVTFAGAYDYDGAETPGTLGPNGYQTYPLLFGAYQRDGGVLVTGRLTGLPRLGGTYQIELYSQSSCASDSVTPGQGEHYLGAEHLYAVAQPVPHPLGALFSLRFPTAAAGDNAVTATATAPDGSTSEFSPCLTLGHKTHLFKTDGVTPTATTIPVIIGPFVGFAQSVMAHPAQDAAIVAARAAGAEQTTKAQSGHGTLDLFCPPGATGYCQGTFVLQTKAKPGELIASGAFKIVPDEVQAVKLTLTGKLMAGLEYSHRLAAVLTTNAHDGATGPDHKNTATAMTLTYN
jgi:hypothetical protein